MRTTIKTLLYLIIVLNIIQVIYFVDTNIINRDRSQIQRAYTVTILNGIPAVNYTATLQVDSLRYHSKESVMIFVDTHVLYLRGDYITFKKN